MYEYCGIKHLFMALLLVPVLLCAGRAEEPTASVKNVAGTVSVQRGGERLVPAAGDVLQSKDVVRTGADGSIGISFVDGTRLSVGPSSEVALREYFFAPMENRFALDVLLRKGAAAYSSGKLGKLAPDAVKIATPEATIGIRGTTFVIKAE